VPGTTSQIIESIFFFTKPYALLYLSYVNAWQGGWRVSAIGDIAGLEIGNPAPFLSKAT
jgi:hypothetical protein